MKQQRNNLLVISQAPLWPNRDGFTLRAIEVLRELRLSWNIWLVAPIGKGIGVDEEEFSFSERRVVPLAEGTESFPRSDQRSLQKEVLTLIAEQGAPHACLSWGFREIPVALREKLPPIVYDIIDCNTLFYFRELVYGPGLRKRCAAFCDFLESLKTDWLIVRGMGATVTVGESDAKMLKRISRRPEKIFVISNGAREQTIRTESDLYPHPTVVFTGVLAYTVNIQAAIYFARSIFPKLRARIPQAEFIIAGRAPGLELLELAKLPGIRIEPDVTDIFALLKRAWVAVAPMRQGCGVKNKVLEAWSVGVPVVMTETAANGIQVDEELKELVCRGSSALTEEIARLLSDKKRMLDLGRLSYELVRARHSWSAVGRSFDRLLRENSLLGN